MNQNIQQKIKQMQEDGSALQLQLRLAKKDLSLWSDDKKVAQDINNRLGWLDCLDLMLEQAQSLKQFAQDCYDRGFRHCLLLGMGGSSLAPELLSQLKLESAEDKALTLQVLDNTAPQVIESVAASLDLERTLFIVASKSGTTIESDALWRYFYRRLMDLKVPSVGQQFVAITDADTSLQHEALEKNFYRCFVNPSDIGGRFSVLSYFGLLPAALLGLDVSQLLHSAKAERESCCCKDELAQATLTGIKLALGFQQGLDKLSLELAPEWMGLGGWLEQLIAESTGKQGKGILPISTKMAKGENRFSLVASLQKVLSDQAMMIESKQVTLASLGAEFFHWQWATAVCGALMQINPFDEPNVGESKKYTLNCLSELTSSDLKSGEFNSKYRVEITSQDLSSGVRRLADFFAQITPEDYLAVLCYGIDEQSRKSLAQTLAESMQQQLGVYTTFSVGPRYLHSTGQLYKGGGSNGAYLLITFESESDLDVVDKHYNFAQLNNAQAQGDLQALSERGKNILQLNFKGDFAQCSPQLIELMKAGLALS